MFFSTRSIFSTIVLLTSSQLFGLDFDSYPIKGKGKLERQNAYIDILVSDEPITRSKIQEFLTSQPSATSSDINTNVSLNFSKIEASEESTSLSYSDMLNSLNYLDMLNPQEINQIIEEIKLEREDLFPKQENVKSESEETPLASRNHVISSKAEHLEKPIHLNQAVNAQDIEKTELLNQPINSNIEHNRKFQPNYEINLQDFYKEEDQVPLKESHHDPKIPLASDSNKQNLNPTPNINNSYRNRLIATSCIAICVIAPAIAYKVNSKANRFIKDYATTLRIRCLYAHKKIKRSLNIR